MRRFANPPTLGLLPALAGLPRLLDGAAVQLRADPPTERISPSDSPIPRFP